MMKASKRKGNLALVLFGIMLLGIPFAANPTPASGQNVTLGLWVGDMLSADEQKLPQDQWYISQAIKRFSQANPNISVEFTVEPNDLQAHQTFKAAAMAKSGPDIAEFWSGMYLFGIKDALMPLDGK